jgi:hypothetical protein
MSNSEENDLKSFKEVEIEFHSRNDVPLSIWVEPSCQNIDIEPGFDYKLIAWENCFRFEFDKKIGIILYLQYSNEFRLYKREYSEGFGKENDWALEYDLSDI